MSLVLPRFMFSGRREQLVVDELPDCAPILGRRHSISVPSNSSRNQFPEVAPVQHYYPFYPKVNASPSDGYFFEREAHPPTKRRKSLCNGIETEEYIAQPNYPPPGSVTHTSRRGSMPSCAHPTAPNSRRPVFRGHPMSHGSQNQHHPRTYRDDAPLSSPLCQPNLSAEDYQQQMLQYERSHYSQTVDSTDTEFLSELEGLELEAFVEDSLHDGSQNGHSPGYTPTDGSFLRTPTLGSDSQGSPTTPYFYDESLRMPDEHFSPHVSPPAHAWDRPVPPPSQHASKEDFSSLGNVYPSTNPVEQPHPSISQFPLARTRVEYPPVQVLTTRAPEKEKRKGLKWTNVTDSVTSKYSQPQIKTRRKGRTSKTSATNQPTDSSEEPPAQSLHLPTIRVECSDFSEIDSWNFS